jgi:hypothetical protein
MDLERGGEKEAAGEGRKQEREGKAGKGGGGKARHRGKR